MIAKLITVAQTREEAIAKMKRALSEFVLEGVETTIPFHKKLMNNEYFYQEIILLNLWKNTICNYIKFALTVNFFRILVLSNPHSLLFIL